VFDTRQLRRLVPASGRLLVDCDGRPVDRVVEDDTPVPGLVVAPITEAVKEIEAGTIVHHLSRDTMWAVEGFLLDRGLLDVLPDELESASELIEAVRVAGFAWHVAPRGGAEVL
jgi:hypothetical protein